MSQRENGREEKKSERDAVAGRVFCNQKMSGKGRKT